MRKRCLALKTMTPTLNQPILIIGQGLAGSILALEADKRGLAYHVLDDGYRSASSLAAAGLYNPFILKRRKLSWKAEEFFPVSRAFFRKMAALLQASFDYEIGIARRVHDVEEYNDWSSKEDDALISPLLGPSLRSDEVSLLLEASQGYRSVPQAGYIDTELFLDKAREYFISKGRFINGRFDEEALQVGDSLNYAGDEYAKVIFCIGYRSREPGRFFQELPFTPAKGHTITISCPDLLLETIVSGPCFILPLGDGLFRIGATYSWSQLDESVEEQEVKKLLKQFRSFCDLPCEVIETKAGVRPATKDRRPLIGASRVDPRVQLFGGMGSRAIMCAPLLAQMYLDHLMTGANIWPEVNLTRVWP